MMTFKQFVAELAREDVAISQTEIEGMTKRFGNKVLQMGHLNDDGSMLVPVDCIIEAVRSLGTQELAEAVESINNEQMVSLLQSGEILVEKVSAARERKLREMIRKFQNEPESKTSHEQWRRIEKEIFGVEYPD